MFYNTLLIQSKMQYLVYHFRRKGDSTIGECCYPPKLCDEDQGNCMSNVEGGCLPTSASDKRLVIAKIFTQRTGAHDILWSL